MPKKRDKKERTKEGEERRYALTGEEEQRERRKKNISGLRAKPSTPTLAIDAPMGEKTEQKTDGRTKERNRERVPKPTTWTI